MTESNTMAGIIKSSGRSEALPGVRKVAFSFDDMSQKADEYLDTIRQQAAHIVAQAKAEAAKVATHAQTQGKQAAIRAAEITLRAELDKKLDSLMPALQQLIEEMQRAREQWLKHWEGNAVRLALAIAARVIRREVQQSPDIAVDLIREALELASANERVVLHLHPADYETLGGSVESLTRQLQQLGPTEVVPDSQVEAGSCLVTTQYGAIDQQFEAQLERIKQELL